MTSLLTAILNELKAIRYALTGWTEIDLSGIEETDEERRMRILMEAL